MSASNWDHCPKCKERIDKLNEAKINAPGQSYGKVAQDIYSKLLEDAKNLLEYDQSLREDYEIGIYHGKFFVKYFGKCDCGFNFEYEHEETLKV